MIVHSWSIAETIWYFLNMLSPGDPILGVPQQREEKRLASLSPVSRVPLIS